MGSLIDSRASTYSCRCPEPRTWAAIGPERIALENPAFIASRTSTGAGALSPKLRPVAEWVYKGVDIDRQKVICVRDMVADENEELLRYFSDRRVWLLEADDVPPKLSPLTNKPPQIK